MQPHSPSSEPRRDAPHIPAVDPALVEKGPSSPLSLPDEASLNGAQIGDREPVNLPAALRSKHVKEWMARIVAEAPTPQLREIYRERIAALFDMKSEGAFKLPVSAVNAFMHRLPLKQQERLYADVVAAVKERSHYFEEYDRFEPLVAKDQGPNNGHLAIPLVRQSYMGSGIFAAHMQALGAVLTMNGPVLPASAKLESTLVACLGISQLFLNHPAVGVPICIASFWFNRFRVNRTPEVTLISGLIDESLLQSHFVSSADEPMISGPRGKSGHAAVEQNLLMSLRFLRLMGQSASNLEAFIPNMEFDKRSGLYPEVQAKVDRYARQIGLAGGDTPALLQATNDLHAIHRLEGALLHHNACVIAQRCVQNYMQD